MSIDFRDVPGLNRSTMVTDDLDAFRDHLCGSRGSAEDVECLRSDDLAGDYQHEHVTFGRCRSDDVAHSGDLALAIRRLEQVVVWWVVEGRVEVTRDGVTYVAEPGEPLLLNAGDSPLFIRLFDAKQEAMAAMEAQRYLQTYYAQRAEQRANHARRASGNANVRHAEAFQRVLPQVVDAL